MTEPDPVAALAAQLEELRGQLARSQGEVGHLRARLEELLRPASWCSRLRDQEARREDSTRRSPGGRPTSPRRRTGSACARDEHAAAARRAAGLGRARRPRPVSRRTWPRLPPCWASHPEAVLGARQPDDGVGPDLRRPGQPAPAGRPLVSSSGGCPASWAASAQALKCDVAGCRPVQCLAAGALATALHLTRPEGPGRASPASGAFGVNTACPGQGMIIGCPFPCSPTVRSGARSATRWRRERRSASAGRHACCGPAREGAERGRGMGHLWVLCVACHEDKREAVFYEPPHDIRHRRAGRLAARSVVRVVLRRGPSWHAGAYIGPVVLLQLVSLGRGHQRHGVLRSRLGADPAQVPHDGIHRRQSAGPAGHTIRLIIAIGRFGVPSGRTGRSLAPRRRAPSTPQR